MLKSQLRKEFLKKRQLLTLEAIHTDSQRICTYIEQHSAWQKAHTIGAYIPFNGEVDLRPLLNTASKAIAIPRLDPNLSFYKFENFESLVANPTFQFLEPPQHAQIIPATQIDLFLIPLIAFNAKGYRLGFGKGHYDQFFHSTACQGLKIGLAYSWQEAEFPIDSWDVPLDLIITETGWSSFHVPHTTKP